MVHEPGVFPGPRICVRYPLTAADAPSPVLRLARYSQGAGCFFTSCADDRQALLVSRAGENYALEFSSSRSPDILPQEGK